MTEAISTCEYIYNMFSVRFSIMYTVYAVSIHLSLLIECEIVRAGEGWGGSWCYLLVGGI